MTPEEVTQQKQIAFYSAAMDAWLTTAMEHDRSVLTLASGALGLLVTLLTTQGLSSAAELVLYVAAILCFGLTIITVLYVFRKNRRYIEDIVHKTDRGNEKRLSIADQLASLAFALGVVLAVLIGISAALDAYAKREQTMANHDTHRTSGKVRSDSLRGMNKLQPTGTAKKSLHGFAGLNPQQLPATPANGNSPSTPAQSGGQGSDKK